MALQQNDCDDSRHLPDKLTLDAQTPSLSFGSKIGRLYRLFHFEIWARFVCSPVKHSLFELGHQIVFGAPRGWTSVFRKGPPSRLSTAYHRYRKSYAPSTLSLAPSKLTIAPCRTFSVCRGVQHAHETESDSDEEDDSPTTMLERLFRKRWPTLWHGIAAADQVGCNLGRPYTIPRKTSLSELDRKASIKDIKKSRIEWATARTDIEKRVEEELWRVDKEKMDYFNTCLTSLHRIPLGRIFDAHQNLIDKTFLQGRCERQKRVLYDCEVNSSWYKELSERIHAQYGTDDEEMNELLRRIRLRFKLSPTEPKYGKAKMALIAMSMPATEICHIHIQRALDFILQKVMDAPPETLAVWLATRGLPYVLV